MSIGSAALATQKTTETSADGKDEKTAKPTSANAPKPVPVSYADAVKKKVAPALSSGPIIRAIPATDKPIIAHPPTVTDNRSIFVTAQRPPPPNQTSASAATTFNDLIPEGNAAKLQSFANIRFAKSTADTRLIVKYGSAELAQTALSALQEVKTIVCKQHAYPLIVGLVGPIPPHATDAEVHEFFLSANPHIRVQRQRYAKSAFNKNHVQFAIPKEELKSLETITQFGNKNLFWTVKDKPAIRFCSVCGGQHLRASCPSAPGSDAADKRPCPNKNCTAIHPISACPSPLKCRICDKDDHAFFRCNEYRGKMLTIKDAIHKMTPRPAAITTANNGANAETKDQ